MAGVGYGRLVVYVDGGEETERAVDVACRLADERAASVLLLAAVVVPPLLPQDAHMVEEEREARNRLRRAHATADSYGVAAAERVVRTRDAAEAVVDAARASAAKAIVLGTTTSNGRGSAAHALGTIVEHVLKNADCRVLVVTAREGS
jgi:nucleotide-binding universal stress UspA family protein